MATDRTPPTQSLAPPAITALRNEDAAENSEMSRSPSVDMRAEREDLKAAAEQSLNVILDLSSDGTIRWVSPSWKDVVGTPVEDVRGKPIADLLLSNNDTFASAVESMKSDDSKSRIIRFRLAMGPHSVLKKDRAVPSEPEEPENTEHRGEKREQQILEEAEDEEERGISLKGQGIMVYDRSPGGDSHVRY